MKELKKLEIKKRLEAKMGFRQFLKDEKALKGFLQICVLFFAILMALALLALVIFKSCCSKTLELAGFLGISIITSSLAINLIKSASG